MSEFLVNLASGKTDEKGDKRLLGRLLNQSGVIQTAAMTVAAQATPDMTVKVSGSTASDDIVFVASDGALYHGWNTASKNVTILSNSSGVTKTDAIVAYADTAAGSSTANNPGGLKFIAVRRSGVNTGNPTQGEIDTATGSMPSVVLAYVTVANGAASINSGNISDARPIAQTGLPVLRQDDTTNTYKQTSITLSGWGVMTVGASNLASETVTFGRTFAQRPIVVVCGGGDAATATTYGSGSLINQRTVALARDITTTNFIVSVFSVSGSNWSAGNTVFYQWFAIGDLT